MPKIKRLTSINVHRFGEKLQVFLFNVGQGDHIMLRFPSGEYGIIDFHYSTNSAIPEPPILSYFKDLKATLPKNEFDKIVISFFCISHTDSDHIKGVEETIRWFYDEGVFIKDFWLGAAENEAQLKLFLKDKIEEIIKTSSLEEQDAVNTDAETYKTHLTSFFTYVQKWEKGEFQNKQYVNLQDRKAEYLAEIRSLRMPCSHPNVKAYNMGPLKDHIKDYINNMNLNVIKDIIGVQRNDEHIDTNLISHILRIKFGQNNLLFGGDTHIDIWESCLSKFENAEYPFREEQGDCKSRFVKVSHHGSKNSTSIDLWQRILHPKQPVFLGISAGRHQRWRHPHPDTIHHIRCYRKDCHIFATNVCGLCMADGTMEKEIHAWYDDYIESNNKNIKEQMTEEEKIIAYEFAQYMPEESIVKQTEIDKWGLFAYIFEIPEGEQEDITVRVALSKNIQPEECFYDLHHAKLRKNCIRDKKIKKWRKKGRRR
jgi:beta-lactamase superfamily II metal-dependent hydrolase